MEQIQDRLNKVFDTHMTIGRKDNTLTILTGSGLTFPEALTMLDTLIYNYMCKTQASAKQAIEADTALSEPEREARLEKVKDEIYDMVNVAASNILRQFAPEIEMRPNLTAEAILKAENAILDEKSKIKEADNAERLQ